MNNADDISQQVADSFRKRRVEKNITRQRISELSGVPFCLQWARFEQKGRIAFESLVRLAMALGYAQELPETRCREIIEEVRSGCIELISYDIMR